MARATMGTRNEIIERHRKEYRKATKKRKGMLLDSICMNTGLSRSRVKHALTVAVRSERKQKKPKTGRKREYGADTVAALEKIWAYMDFACGRRLVAGMRDMLEALERFGEMAFDDAVKQKLNGMSASTADRLLKHAREKMQLKGRSTTKPGTLNKRDIPFRLGNEWDDAIPGYVEIDLVAHCGDTTAGDYVNTLDVTDICTGWTETQAVLNKAQKHVFNALMAIQARLPFPFRGIDSDNGSEFINHQLLRYCKENDICFTRSRPGRKNDNCHVEQKNWHVVRQNIGYGRYEGPRAVAAMNEYYSRLRLYSNFFLPQTKLISKTRDGARIKKRYDEPKTPYRRVLESEHIGDDIKISLTEIYESLNPARLKRDMMLLLKHLERQQIPLKSAAEQPDGVVGTVENLPR